MKRYVCHMLTSLSAVLFVGCTTELNVQIPYVVFEVRPPQTKVFSKSTMKVFFKSLEGTKAGPVTARLEDPTGLFEVEPLDCDDMSSGEACEVFVTFHRESCGRGLASAPERSARLVVESSFAGTAVAHLEGSCDVAGGVLQSSLSAH